MLAKGTLTRRESFMPESMPLDLEERNSRAVITVGPEAPEITIGDWMTDDTDPGKDIVWRVSAVEPTYENETRRITVEHIIAELKDRIIFGETQMHGNCAAALRNILGRSDHWVLGDCEYSKSLPYEFDGDTLYEAVEGVCETLEDCCWEYDLSALPFKLHIRKLREEIGTEMRAGRNIRTIRRTIDKNGMYTRFYPIGKEEMRLAGTSYVSRNEDIYGVISQTETNQAIDSQSMLRSWAESRVRRHSDPTVTVTVSGIELAASTGEPLDRFRLLAMCRIPIPEIGEVITERITHLSYRDKIADPEGVTVTMSNKREDAVSLTEQIREASKAARSGGRGASKKAEEDHAWFTDTTDHVSLTAEAIVGKNPDGSVDWGRVADITVNGSGIYSTVTKTEKDMVTAQSSIKQLENTIDMTVRAVGKDGKITAASIAMAIDNAGSSVTISADHISLSGSVTVGDALGVYGSGILLKKSLVGTGSTSLLLSGSGGVEFGTYRLDSGTIRRMVKTVGIDNDDLVLERFDGSKVNFSKATTLSGKWSGGTYTVTAKQRSKVVGTNKTAIKQLNTSGSVRPPIGTWVFQEVRVYATENGGSSSTYTGFAQDIGIDASAVYNNGYADGRRTYSFFGAFTKYGSEVISGKTAYLYYTYDTSANTSQLKLYRDSG